MTINNLYSRHLLAAALLLAAAPAIAAAQGTSPGSSSSAQPGATRTGPSISGTIRGNYSYLLGGPREDFNQFVVERVYVTVRGPVAPRTSFRVTSDVYQSGDANGWTVRMKYAYLDYLLSEGAWATSLRGGILQTVAIEKQEELWPRWLGPVAIDRHGFFQSADVGASITTELPSDFGEVFAHVVNGTGYTRRETDRFKDFGARATLTPLAGRAPGLLGSLSLTGWVYEGATASSTNQALQRDRWGVHAGVKAPRLVAAVDHSRRTDEAETGTPAVVVGEEEAVTSAFAIVHPLTRADGVASPALGLVGRYDNVAPVGDGGDGYHYLLGGVIWTIHSRLAVSLNYQEQLGQPAPSPFRGAFMNFVLDF